VLQGAVATNKTTLQSSSATAALDIPLASRAAGPLGFLGDLSASAEFSRQQISDFGSFNNYRLSLLWRPRARLTLSALINRSDSAPSVLALDEPILETPGVRYFDPQRGETVDVTLVTGGASGLLRESDQSTRITLEFKPFRRLRLNAEYLELTKLNATSELPVASRTILNTFPDRFRRDATGRLALVDARSVSLPSRDERQLRTGLILDLPLGANTARNATAVSPEDDESVSSNAPRLETRGRRRLQISAGLTWLFTSTLIATPGGTRIDLLSREAVGFGALGQPRRRLDTSVSYTERGLGARFSLQSRGMSFVEADGKNENVLRFAPLTSLSIRAWIQGERITRRLSVMRGTRISVVALNVTGARNRVADMFGTTPLRYQEAYRDPIGRSVELEVRKRF